MNDEQLNNDIEDLSDIFEEFEKEKKAIKKRPGLEIAKCCGNCKYFKYSMGNQRRGLCMRDELMKRKQNRVNLAMTRENFKRLRDSNDFPKTHITCVCSKHKLGSFSKNVRYIRDYCGIKDLKIADDF